jgi:NAD(P)-dependent dehydrogenase (short-subunit alcohol dehydrogenase family)
MAGLFDLGGKVAAITGSSRGIGRELALGFAAAGAAVAGCARSADGSERTAAEIRAAGGRAIGIAADMTTREGADRLVAEAVAAFGRLDIMIANAGIDITQPAKDFSAEEFDRVIAGNLRAAFLSAQAAAEQFRRQGRGGAIVMTSSNASVAAFENLTPYCAAKGGIDALVRALAAEWGPEGIRVNAINPGYTSHAMNPNSTAIMAREHAAIIARTPLRRIAHPREMVGPAVFLASDAAAYVTGVALLVDGGWCAQ